MLTDKTQTRKSPLGALVLGGFILFSAPENSYGVPYFARKYNVTCQTCHVLPPKLNQVGENFRANDYKLPGVEPAHRTWPFALWLTQRGESQSSRDFKKTLPNKVEVISGAPIGHTPLSYFLEWRLLSLQTRSDGSVKDRSGRFEDLFITYRFFNSFRLTAGQFRLLRQVDNSQKWGLSTPRVIGAKIAGREDSNKRKTSLRAFTPQGRSPAISLEYQTLKGVNAADGWFNVISLPFPGELSIPLTDEARDEASFEFESDPKGVFFESFYNWGLSSVGAHLFVGNDRGMGSVLGRYNRGRWFSMLGVGIGRVGGKTDGRVSWENEFIPLDFFAIKALIDHQTDVKNGTAFVPSVNLRWPGSQWTLLLVVEQRVQTDKHATLVELSLIF